MEQEEHKAEAAGMMRWLLTYADCITLLLGVFIILAAISASSQARYQIIAEQAARVFGAGSNVMNTGVGKGMPGGTGVMPFLPKPKEEEGKAGQKLPEGVQVVTTTLGTRITISSAVVFDSGSSELKPAAKKIIDQVYDQFLSKTTNSILITGHTDDRPISSVVFPSNWELSTGRAGSVARYMINRWKLPQTRLTISGYADMQPVASNATEEGRAKNRRIEIWVLGYEANKVMKKLEEANKQPSDLLGGGF